MRCVLTDSKLADSKLTDSKLADSKLTDSKLADSKLTDIKWLTVNWPTVGQFIKCQTDQQSNLPTGEGESIGILSWLNLTFGHPSPNLVPFPPHLA